MANSWQKSISSSLTRLHLPASFAMCYSHVTEFQPVEYDQKGYFASANPFPLINTSQRSPTLFLAECRLNPSSVAWVHNGKVAVTSFYPWDFGICCCHCCCIPGGEISIRNPNWPWTHGPPASARLHLLKTRFCLWSKQSSLLASLHGHMIISAEMSTLVAHTNGLLLKCLC